MLLKKEWQLFLVLLIVYYLDYIIDIEMDGWYISSTPWKDVIFTLFHATLFALVNYVLLEKYFLTRRYLLFVLGLFILLSIYGVIEEGILEKILTPRSRGRDPVNWRNILMYWGEMTIPLLAFIAVKLMRANYEKEKRLEQIAKDSLKNELKLLKSQIQPHVLFNSLNNLYNFTLNKSDKAPELVLKLSNVLRYITYETAVEKVLLTKELAFIEDYIDLQKMQYAQRGKIVYDNQMDTPINHLKIAPFILIPFIENSFKHSFGTKIRAVEVHVRVQIQTDKLSLWVSNNFEQDTNDKSVLTVGGIGLQNVQQRLELLYPQQYQLDIQQTKERYEVNLQLMLKTT